MTAFTADAVLRRLVPVPDPVVLDVGANVGQSVERFRRLWPECRIHSFEPAPDSFAILAGAWAGTAGVTLNNCGVGAREGSLTFHYYPADSETSSFLPRRFSADGEAGRDVEVPVVTIDGYLEGHGIGRVDVCKIDTQGFSEQCVLGAAAALAGRRIGILQIEYVSPRWYAGCGTSETLHSFLFGQGYIGSPS